MSGKCTNLRETGYGANVVGRRWVGSLLSDLLLPLVKALHREGPYLVFTHPPCLSYSASCRQGSECLFDK